MRENRFEKFIMEHRHLLDDEIPDGSIWDRIYPSIEIRKRGFKFKVISFSWAACFLLVIGISLVLFPTVNSFGIGTKKVVLSPELQEIENFYLKEIKARVALVVDKDQKMLLNQEFEQLDFEISRLTTEIKSTPLQFKSQLINHLIQIYKLKIKVLDRILQHDEESVFQNLVNNENQML